MQPTTKTATISSLITAVILATGAIGFDASTITPVEDLETKLAPYDMTIADVSPFDKAKVEEVVNSKTFTPQEEVILTAILQGDIPYIIVDGDFQPNQVTDIYSSISTKLGVTYDNTLGDRNIMKLIRKKVK